jgi:hypothetical protein
MESLEHTYPGTIGYLAVPLSLNTWWRSEWHTPQWVIRKVTSSGPGILLQQTEETWVFSHDESLFTEMENLWHSSLAEPNKKKHQERERERAQKVPNLRLNLMGTNSPFSSCAPYPMQSIGYSADNFPHIQSVLPSSASSLYNFKHVCHKYGPELKILHFSNLRQSKEGK